LQLFYSQDQFRQGLGDDLTPEVYNLYKSTNLVKYPSTLTVTVKSVLPPKKFASGLRSFYTFQEEKAGDDDEEDEGMNTEHDEETLKYFDETDVTLNKQNTARSTTTKQQQGVEKSSVIWSRLAGQACRIPNDLFLNLPSGKNGCYSIRFSRNGSYIACGSVEENNVSPILVYEIPDGKLAAKFIGHFGLIYELDWSKYDKYILTASNDATAR
jgi:jouberin